MSRGSDHGGRPPLHHCAEQYQSGPEGGWTVVCACGRSFTRPTRDEALADHTGHFQVVRLRDQIKAGRQTGEDAG